MTIAAKLQRLVQLQTISEPSAATAETAQAFQDFPEVLRELFPLVHEQLEQQRIESALVFRWREADPTAQPVVLMAHYDVVPAETPQEWTHPPFAGVVAGGWLYGRGTLDDKGALCVLLEAVEQLLAEGFVPERDTVIALGGDEEIHGKSGRAVAADFKNRGEIPWLVIDEGGAILDRSLPGLEIPAAMVGVAEKGIATYEITATAAGGHASAPPKLSAIGRFSRAIVRLEQSPFPPRTSRAVSDMIAVFQRAAGGKTAKLLSFLKGRPRLTAQLLARQGGESAAMVRTTVAPTMVAGGSAQNVLAANATATLNCRIAPGSSVAATTRKIERIINDLEVTVTLLDGEEPTGIASTDCAQWRLVDSAVTAVWSGHATVPYLMLANTDSRHWHRFAKHVYRIAPLEMPGELRSTVHAVDERIEVSALGRGVEFWCRFISAIPGADPAESAAPTDEAGQ